MYRRLTASLVRMPATSAQFKTRECPVCGGPVVSHINSTDAHPRTYCKRECILEAVGLPQDFDPALFKAKPGTLTQDTIDEMHRILDETVSRTPSIKAVTRNRAGSPSQP